MFLGIFFSRSSLKALKRMDTITKQRMKSAIEGIPEGDIKKLKGYSIAYRLRVGGYRILFDMDGENIFIQDILPRGSAYKA